MIKQSFAWWTFETDDVKPEDLISAATDIGYQAIELAPIEIWPIAKDYGLEIINAGAHPRIPKGLNRKENLSMIKAELEQSIELALEWGLHHLICFSGDRQGLSDTEGLDNAVANLEALMPLAESAGVTLAFEVLNSKVDHPDYHADKLAWGLELLKRVDSPRLKLLFDIYHTQVMEGDIIRTIRANHDLVTHYHTAGHPGRHDLDDEQEINYPAIFKTIKATGYQGYIGHEFTPKGDTIKALKAAFELTTRAFN